MAFLDGLSQFAAGSEGGWKQSPNKFSPQAQQGMNQQLSRALQGLNGNNLDFSAVRKNAQNNFNQNTAPSIAERFTQLGGSRSSGIQNALASAGKDLDLGLGAQESQYNLSKENAFQNLFQNTIQPQHENYYQQSQPGLFNNPDLLNTLLSTGLKSGSSTKDENGNETSNDSGWILQALAKAAPYLLAAL